MLIKKNLKFGLRLLPILAGLSSCSCKVSYDYCPVYPKGGEKVGLELSKLKASDFPNTFEWLSRIYKLRQELDICREKTSLL